MYTHLYEWSRYNVLNIFHPIILLLFYIILKLRHQEFRTFKKYRNISSGSQDNRKGGRIIDNLQIVNLQIDNLQIDKLTNCWQIDNWQIVNWQIDNLQIDNLTF